MLLVLAGCGAKESAELPARTEVVRAAETAAETPPEEVPAEKPTGKPTETPTAPPKETEKPGPIIDPQEIADYLFTYGKLPDNFITKQEAQNLGWDSSRNYVSDVAPGKSIGGDRFGNYEGNLPKVKGRTYYEADCGYTRGKRGAARIVYSSDGHVWYTEDHYTTFTELFPSGQDPSE
ncbi:MAG: ribonuclease [Clostridiales bacterium]|nr:ribonuclease [Clostridiales bacterium]